MEKLIELLNEYEKVREKSEYQKLSNKEYKWFSSYFFPFCFGHKDDFSGAMTNEFGEGTENVICSNQFGFIKWLVENEKIDYEKIEKQTKCKNIVGGKEFLDFDIERDFTPYEEVLMWLAIQDNPIEFLVSILK